MPDERSRVLTLVFTDLADSTALKTARGDKAVRDLIREHEKHITRRLGMTVREFETQLVSLGLDNSHIQRLTRLFEFVRYSPNTPGDSEEREAIACLYAIVRAYGEST